MPPTNKGYDDIKRKLRELKKYELRLRSNNITSNSINFRKASTNELVWSKFFDLKEGTEKNVKYTIDQLYKMTKDEFKVIIEEYFYHLYYWYYKENGLAEKSLINIDILTELGLPMNSDYDDVIREFKEQVKAYHPDNGGDVARFLEIMDSYNNFRNER